MDPENEPIAYEVLYDNGPLPSWLDFSDEKTLEGIPPADERFDSPARITVIASDQSDYTETYFDLEIKNNPPYAVDHWDDMEETPEIYPMSLWEYYIPYESFKDDENDILTFELLVDGENDIEDLNFN